MAEPEYIKPEYAELFKELTPEDLQLPEWLHQQIQNYSTDHRTLARKAIFAALTGANTERPFVRTDDDFRLELMLRRERNENARKDLVTVLSKIAAKKAIPFEEQVTIEPLRQRKFNPGPPMG